MTSPELGSSEVRTVGGRACVVERIEGPGTPVLFTNGCGLPRGMWRAVTGELARPSTLFDRPGLGTPWPGRLPTLAEEVELLAALARERPGGVLVAHSMAAFHAEALLLVHPGLVGALVLVDPSIEWTAKPSVVETSSVGSALGRRLADLTRRHLPEPVESALAGALGTSAVLVSRMQTHHRLSRAEVDAIRSAYSDASAAAMAAGEWFAYRQQAADLVALRERLPLHRVPTTVLTAIPHQPSASQRRYVERLGARHVLVSHSRHLLMLDAPQAVRAAIAAPGRQEPLGSAAT